MMRMTAAPRVPTFSAAPTPALTVQARVILAVILREMRTRFGRTKLGYLWALAEPVIHIGTMLAIFAALRRSSPIGGDLPLFFTTGIIPWLLFSNTAGRVTNAVDANRALLSYPQVTPLDLMMARAVLEAATILIIFILLLGGLAVAGSVIQLDGFLDILAAFVCTMAFGTGLGMINAAVMLLLPSYDRVFSPIMRLLYFVSGVFFTADTLPHSIRDWLLLNPVLHQIEWVRSGFFEGFDSQHLDRGYALFCAAALLFIGLAAERVARPRVEHA
jgi:capsular polysaccharide transport system permease protein